MSDWTNAGLPLAQLRDYEEEIKARVERTPFITARPYQRTSEFKWTNVKCSFILTHAELKAAEAFIANVGYSGFTFDLSIGFATVRLIKNPIVDAMGEDYYRLTLLLELYEPRTIPTFGITQFNVDDINNEHDIPLHITQFNVTYTGNEHDIPLRITQFKLVEILDASGDYP